MLLKRFATRVSLVGMENSWLNIILRKTEVQDALVSTGNIGDIAEDLKGFIYAGQLNSNLL